MDLAAGDFTIVLMRIVNLPAAGYLVEHRLARGVVAKHIQRVPAEVEATLPLLGVFVVGAAFDRPFVPIGLALGEPKSPTGEVPIEALDARYGVLRLLLFFGH